MSTTKTFLGNDDIEGFASDLKEWPNSSYGNDQVTHNVSPFVSFYFLYDSKHHLDTSLLMVDIHEQFERLTGTPYLIGTHPDSERPHPYGSKRLPDLREFARKTKKQTISPSILPIRKNIIRLPPLLDISGKCGTI